MNKTTTFILGLLTGAAGGAAATYFLVKEKFEEDRDLEIADMEDYFEERFQEKVRKLKAKSKKSAEEKIEEKPEFREDEKIANNEGVKKYHHNEGLSSAYGAKRIFGEDAKPKKESKKVIREISEQEFMNAENGYEKQTVDVWMSNDDEEPEIVGLWAYNTDNEEDVKTRFKKPILDLLDGRTYEELANYCHEGGDDEEDDGIGVLYLKNDDLHIDFEFVLHDEG